MEEEKRKPRTASGSHHPWEEGILNRRTTTTTTTGAALTRFLVCMAPVMVSLPGAGGPSGLEQQTILQVLNNVNSTPAEKPNEAQHNTQCSTNASESVQRSVKEPTGEAVNSIDDPVSENSDTAAIPVGAERAAATKDCATVPVEVGRGEQNVHDFESHLIETYNEYQANDDSVRIKELPPIQDELTAGSSKIETDANVHSVIEVEPVGAKTKQPIETLIHTEQPQLATEKREDTAKDSTELEHIKRTAEQLVDEIEKEVLRTLSELRQSKRAEEKAEAETETATVTSETLNNETNEEAVANATNSSDEKTDNPSILLDELNTTLSRKVDEHLSEVTSILKTTSNYGGETPPPTLNLTCDEVAQVASADLGKVACNELKIVDVPSPKTPLEAEERKQFIESLPQIERNKTDDNKLAADCKREYYQSLKKYLIQQTADRPPVPLQTYRWEDLKRARERGGYPWTHLYKRPLGPDEEPEIVLLLRKSQELRFTSESPKSLKKVRIDEQVIVQETERYLQELSEAEEDEEEHPTSDVENHSLHSESISCVSDSVLAVGKPRKSNRLTKIRGILKRRRSGRSTEDAQSLPGTSTNTSRHHSEESLTPQKQPHTEDSPQHKTPRCYPIMKKLKSMADRQKKRLNIKRISLKKDEKIVLDEEPKILKLKSSPKFERGEIPHFIEKQDSDDVLEIMELDESPSRSKRRDNDVGADNDDVHMEEALAAAAAVVPKTSIVEPDEIIEITKEPQTEVVEEQQVAVTATEAAMPPRKAPRLRREHVYEEIEQTPTLEEQLCEILETSSVEALKQSLAKQDNYALKDMKTLDKPIPLDRMGSSEEEQIAVAASTAMDDAKHNMSLLAPLSSIDSASSDEDRNRAQLSPVAEESDVASTDERLGGGGGDNEQSELKPSIKKEASPAPSDKKVTFSHVEDEAEPHREDIELSDEAKEATAAASKWKDMSDHEYEPIGGSSVENKPSISKEPSPHPQGGDHDEMRDAELLQKDLEDRYFSSEATTPRTESRTDYDIHTSQVDSSALEELPLKPENRKKGFMATAQDRTRKMQVGLKNQAGKIKTKLRTPAKKPPSGSPKAKERKRFKAPEFSKIKMPDIKRPDMSKFKEFKRPEFTKFSKPDMSKLKLSEKFSTIKLGRSKSFKENVEVQDEDMTEVPEKSLTAEAQPQKKMFDFKFGTYPRAFRKKKQPPVQVEQSFDTTGTEGLSIIPSTETQPSVESSSSPQGDRGPGPVRSRWADKFSDVSYNDSEGSRYRRYGSEQESFDRESSFERRIKDELEETGSETPELGILGVVTGNKEFAEFDEENRAIHEISNLRAGEFRRRPMIHQDSDLRSEDSKDVEGWTDKEIQKNKLLRKAELEAEASYLKYPAEEGNRQETQSTASSGKKVVMEEIDDDEFFLRKRGISEDNIELRRYITNAIREGYEQPMNALQQVGRTSEPVEYDVPPPKPRRLHKAYRPEDASQEFEQQRSDYGDDLSVSQNGSDFFGAPKRPMRKGRSQSKYSMDSQDASMVDENLRQGRYFDDDEDYLRPPPSSTFKEQNVAENNLNFFEKQVFSAEQYDNEDAQQPHAPRRRKRQLRESSIEKDGFVNGFGGRSVSNSYLQPTEDVIVYRTEHEYHIPLATPENYTDGASRKSGSTSRFDEDDRTSRGADSLALDANLRAELDQEAADAQEKFVIDMMENDGYAIVRKEHIPKPTPPARRKKFSRSPGERFTTMPNARSKRSTPPPERPPPPREYKPTEDVPPMIPVRKSALSSETSQK